MTVFHPEILEIWLSSDFVKKKIIFHWRTPIFWSFITCSTQIKCTRYWRPHIKNTIFFSCGKTSTAPLVFLILIQWHTEFIEKQMYLEIYSCEMHDISVSNVLKEPTGQQRVHDFTLKTFLVAKRMSLGMFSLVDISL